MNQAGNINYTAAPTVTETTTVAVANAPTVSLTAPASAYYQSTYSGRNDQRQHYPNHHGGAAHGLHDQRQHRHDDERYWDVYGNSQVGSGRRV